MSDIANLGFSVDTAPLKKGEKALDSFASTGEKTEKRTDKSSKKIIDDFDGIEKAVGRSAAEQMKADKAMAQLSRRSGQAGIQFQQFIGQVQGGQGVMLALSQQSADLGFVLGAPLLGAVAGISASLLGMLVPSLFSTETSMDKLEKAIESINEVMTTDSDGIVQYTEKLKNLERVSTDLLNTKLRITIQEQKEAFKLGALALQEYVADVTGFTRGFSSFDDQVKAITKTMFGTDEFEKGKVALINFKKEVALFNARPAVDTAENLVAAINSLESSGASATDSGRKLLDMALEQVTAFRQGKSTIEDLNQALEDNDKITNNNVKSSSELKSINDGITSTLEAQIIALRDGEDAALAYNIAQKLGLKTGEAIPAEIQKQIDAIKLLKQELQEESDLMKEIALDEKFLANQRKKIAADEEKARKRKVSEQEKSDKEFESLTKQIENFGGAWTRTGSVIVDTFGDISDAMNDYMSQMRDIEKNESKLADFRKEKGEDNIEVIALQRKIESDRVSAELSGIKSLSKAGQSLFDEKTAAAKAFAALNKVITVAEIALSFQKMAAGTAEAGVHVANETTKQGANALTAITSAFAAPFPVNFVAGAAMIGIMGSLLGGVFGGGSSFDPTEDRQEAQGTGTVLGSDDKSSSILESQERFEDLQIDQLSELRGIRDSLNNVASGIALVTRDLVASRGLGDFSGDLTGSRAGESSLGKIFSGEIFGIDFGGLGEKLISGIFGSTKKKVTDSGIQFIAQSLGQILEDGVVQASQFFDIEKTKKKLFGLSKKVSTSTEFQALDSSFGEGIGAIFKNIGDVVLQSAELLGFEAVNVIGKGFSVSLEDALAGFNIDIGKISLEGLTGDEIEQELQAIFSQQADLIAEYLVPSIKEYQKVGEGLFDTLTRVTKEQVIFNDSIERMGFDLTNLSNVMQIDIAQSIIALTGGAEEFADLTSSFFDNFFSESEQLAALEKSISDVFDSLGLSMIDSRDGFKALIEGIDITTDEGQQLLATLLEINPALSDYIDELERIESKRADMTIELLELQGKSEEALAMQRKIELEALDDSLKALQLLIYAEEDRISLLNKQQDAAKSSFSMLEKSIELEKQRAQAVLDAANVAHESELERIDVLRAILEAENTLRQENLSLAEQALSKAFDSEIKKIQDTSAEEIALIQSNSDARLSGLNGEKDAIKATESSMKSLISSINSSLGLSGSSDLIGALASARQGDFSKAQSLDISGLSNLEQSGFSSANELAVQQALNKNRLKAIGELAEDQLSDAQMTLAAIEYQTESIIDDTKAQVEAIQSAADLQVFELQEQLNALLGIDTSILSINDAITDFKEAQQAVIELGYQKEIEKLDMLVNSANEVYELHKQAYESELERLDVILSDNEALLNVALGIDSSVLSVVDAISALNNSISEIGNNSSPAVNAVIPEPVGGIIYIDDPKLKVSPNNSGEEIKKMREDNEVFQREIVKNTKKTARILQQLSMDGIETRSEQ